jgi:hypothetical protein
MDAEIDILVNNFKQLWQSGRSAHLDIDTHAGQAWIGLRVRLGHQAGPHHQQQVHSKTGARNSPSRQRRRIRRAAAREKAAEEVVRNESQVDIAAVEANGNKETDHEETTEQSEASMTGQVTDEFCSNSEYDGNAKPIDHDDNETKAFQLYCWAPDSKWDIQHVESFPPFPWFPRCFSVPQNKLELSK